MSIRIAGTGRAVPKKQVSNDALSEFLETSDEWIATRTGIRSRHIITDETLTELSRSASLSALQKAQISVSDIELILCSTLCGDYTTPALACSIQKEIGANCPAFDLNAACSGFIYALDIADAYIRSGKASNVLIVCSEAMSNYVDWTDRATCVLFGDGVGACVVTAGNALQHINLTADGNVDLIQLKTGNGNNPFSSERAQTEFLKMNGREVYKFAVNVVEKEARAALEALGLQPEEIDHFVLHQANKRIIDAIRSRLKLPEERFPLNIQDYGNTSSASIPILLDEMLEKNEIQPGDRLFLCAFGAGMTTGSCVLVWE